MITANTQKYIAKFSSQNELYNAVKAEFVAMRLAAKTGLAAAPSASTVPLERTFC